MQLSSRVQLPVRRDAQGIHDGNRTTAEMRASHGDLRLSWRGRYAAVAEVNWTNQ